MVKSPLVPLVMPTSPITNPVTGSLKVKVKRISPLVTLALSSVMTTVGGVVSLTILTEKALEAALV